MKVVRPYLRATNQADPYGLMAEKLKFYSEERPNGCVVWKGGKNKNYGVVRNGKRVMRAHAAAWELANGPVPSGLCVLHNCPAGDNPLCINVDHLWLGTHADNHADCLKKGRRPSGYKWRPKPAKMTAADLGMDDFPRETISQNAEA